MSTPARLIFLCGKMAAGKSTLARELARGENTVLLVQDDLLDHLFPNEITDVPAFVKYSARLRNAIGPHVCALLSQGISVVLDFPGNTRAQRAWFRGLFERAQAAHELHFVDASDALCKRQLRQRSRDLPAGAPWTGEADFEAITRYFQPPADDEGFNVVRHERPDDGGGLARNPELDAPVRYTGEGSEGRQRTMARSAALHRLARTIRIARLCDQHGLAAREGLERVAAYEAAPRERGTSRRDFLAGTARLAALGAIGAAAGPFSPALAAPRPPRGDVAIVGAGLAGLACGDQLRQHGVRATVYEASNRAGGRCFSLGGAFPGPVTFPGQVVERGGEFIDTGHKTMIGYAQQLGLALEDVTKGHEDTFYHFFGQRHSEAEVVDELRQLVDAMRDDLRTVGQPTADSFTPADAVLDRTSLQEYLETRGAGRLIEAVIDVAYTIEYGLEIDRQSCLNFLFFIHADRRSTFTPFGTSDERYHVIGGNQQIPAGLAAPLGGQIQYGTLLQRVRKTPAGRIELTLRRGTATVNATYDAVVLAIPFSVLREVELDASLGLPAWKLFAIQNLGYGTSAKMMLGFNGPLWLDLGSDGQSFSDLANHQNTWETNPIRATPAHAVLTDYSGGDRGARLDPRRVQTEAARFLGDLDTIYPGALHAATRDARGNFLVHLEHWSSNPLTKGAYTCNQPGYFTTIADNEQKPVGNLFFAGEHTSSFYEWQGFMEGGVVSGLRAAAEVLQAL